MASENNNNKEFGLKPINYENGVYEISNAAYHEASALSRSALMKFKKSPYHYWYEYLSGEAAHVEGTPAMVFGELVHTLSLEPHEFENRFVVAPECDRRTKEGKKIWSIFQAALTNCDQVPVKAEEVEVAKRMSWKVRDNTLVDSLLEDSSIEYSVFFTHATTGIQCKIRPDIWNGGVVGDLKTTMDASYRAFQSSAWKYGYFLQAGMMKQGLYSIGIELEKFIFIPVEKEPPYAVGLNILDDEALDYGSQQFDKLMEQVARCRDSGNWQDYGIQNLMLPNYAKFYELRESE